MDEDPLKATADEAKAEGDAAFKAGDFDGAVKHYTEAIEAVPNEVLYSNRSGAYAKLSNYKNALLDANKCIDLKPAWAKGHSRRGAAYQGLRSFRAALSAYEEGLKIDPTNEHMLTELKRMQEILDKQMNGASAGGGGGPPPAAPVAAPSKMHGMLSLNVLVFGLFYVLPFFPSRAIQSYRFSIGFFMALLANSLLATWRPKGIMASVKDPAFLRSQEVQALLLCLMMLVSPPMPFALMPFGATALVNVCNCYRPIIEKLPNMVSSRAQFLTTEEGANMAQAFGAVSEVIVAVACPLVVAANGLRSAVLAFFYFQYVARRYNSSFWTKQAVTALTEKLNGIFHHRYCPAPVGMLFDRLKGVVAMLADKVQQ